MLVIACSLQGFIKTDKKKKMLLHLMQMIHGQFGILILFGVHLMISEVRVCVECKRIRVLSFDREGLNWFSYPIKILITISISFLHTGQGDLFFFNIFAHLKQATR